MKLFEYKPTEYVDVYPDLPLEWMQKEIDKTQTKYDAKLGAVNDLNKQFADMQAGAQTQEELKAVNDLYSKKINDMVTGLTGTGYIPQTSADLAKFITDVAIDPKVKQIKDDRAAYEIYLKNKLDPQYAGAYDKMQDWDKAKHGNDLSYYNLIPAENSIAELEQTVNKLKPNSTDGGKTFSFYDPITDKVVQSTDKFKIEELSAKRIKQLRDNYYLNWVNNPKSLFHKTKLSKNNLDIYNTPEGKKIYDDLTEYLQSYAYTDYQDIPDANPYNSNSTKPTKPGGDNSPETPTTFIPQTTSPYGRQYTLGEVYNKPGTFLTDPDAMAKNLANLDNDALLAARNMQLFKDDPTKKAEYDKALATYTAVKERKKIDESWQRIVEGDYYGKIKSADFAAANAIEQKWIDEHQQQIADFGALSLLYKKPISQIKNDILYNGVTTYGGVNYDKVEKFLKDAKDFRNKSLTGDMKAVFDRYQKYNGYETTGTSYIVNGAKNKEAAAALFNVLVSSGKIPKNIMTDKQANEGDLTDALKAYKTANGYDYGRISYEILADDMDGLVFVQHLLDEDGKSRGFEWKLEDTPNVREFLGEILPHESAILQQFTEATQSLKGSHRQSKGSFDVQRFDGSSDDIDFNRRPVGDGQFEYFIKYTDTTGVEQERVYPSINKMIIGESLPKKLNDQLFMQAYTNLQNAINSRDLNSYQKALIEIGELKAERANAGKQNPKGQQDPLGVKKK
jgi:hypothetical protein